MDGIAILYTWQIIAGAMFLLALGALLGRVYITQIMDDEKAKELVLKANTRTAWIQVGVLIVVALFVVGWML